MSSTTCTLEHVVKLVGDYNPDEIAYVRVLDDYLEYLLLSTLLNL